MHLSNQRGLLDLWYDFNRDINHELCHSQTEPSVQSEKLRWNLLPKIRNWELPTLLIEWTLSLLSIAISHNSKTSIIIRYMVLEQWRSAGSRVAIFFPDTNGVIRMAHRTVALYECRMLSAPPHTSPQPNFISPNGLCFSILSIYPVGEWIPGFFTFIRVAITSHTTSPTLSNARLSNDKIFENS